VSERLPTGASASADPLKRRRRRSMDIALVRGTLAAEQFDA
jgi:hypothetical protein